MEKKKFQRILSCLFDGRGKVQFRRKKLGEKVQAKSSNLPRRFCSNSVGTPLEFAAFRSGFDAKYTRASGFWFCLSTAMVFTAFRTRFARKNTKFLHADRQLVTKKEISIKINFHDDNQRSWPSGPISGFSRRRAGFGSRRGQEIILFFFSFLFFFNLTT